MSSPVSLAQSLAEIVGTRPGAARVLRSYGLDFSCEGGRSLAQACEGCDVDPGEVRRALIAARAEPDDVRDWTERPLTELVAHIKERYHERHRIDLPYLIELAHRVEKRHGHREDCPRGLEDLLARLREDLEGHLDEEEQVVFPLVLNGAKDGLTARSFAPARSEHDHHLEAMKQARALTSNYAPPVHPCRTWHALMRGLADLERDLIDHVHLENNVLFPRAATEGLI
jgi:regulator of cell morphogenesis and NO signaling